MRQVVLLVLSSIVLLAPLQGCDDKSPTDSIVTTAKTQIPNTSFVINNQGHYLVVSDTISNSEVILYLNRKADEFQYSGVSIRQGDRLGKKMFYAGFDTTGAVALLEYWTGGATTRGLLKRDTMWFNLVSADSSEVYAKW